MSRYEFEELFEELPKIEGYRDDYVRELGWFWMKRYLKKE